MNRNLDGIYFRVKRGDKYETLCFSDLEEKEMISVLERYDKEDLLRMCIVLGETIKLIGEEFDLMGEE